MHVVLPYDGLSTYVRTLNGRHRLQEVADDQQMRFPCVLYGVCVFVWYVLYGVCYVTLCRVMGYGGGAVWFGFTCYDMM